MMKSYGEWRAPPLFQRGFDAGLSAAVRIAGDEVRSLVSRLGVDDAPVW